jgi:SAM-dependent methyltransferase
MLAAGATDEHHDVKLRTARSFAYEWEQFGSEADWWAKNFREYLGPIAESSLNGLTVLDVGAGSGRHSFHANRAGAGVVAVDIGDSIDTARGNLPDEVLTVQADAELLPFAPESFDVVMSIGVLHHLPDTESALRGLVRYVKPGGWLHVYLYWVPPLAFHRHLLRVVNVARRLSVRMPHRFLHVLCYPLALLLEALFVAPYRALRHRPRGRVIARLLPLKAYADYPFSVLVNDQFDRFSAPIERRFEFDEVIEMMRGAGLTDVTVFANNGWVARGRRARSGGTETAPLS